MRTLFLAKSAALCLCAISAASAFGQAESRGSIAVYPVIFDKSGTETSRTKAADALNEIFKKGGFKVLDKAKARSAWASKGYRTPTLTRPPSAAQLAGMGRSAKVDYVCTTSVTFHTRSIWVNLGPKTISTCHMTITIVDVNTGKIAYEMESEGRSDEKTDNLKVAGALLISPLITAVSGGPKTPQESRAAQIAASNGLEKFIVVP